MKGETIQNSAPLNIHPGLTPSNLIYLKNFVFNLKTALDSSTFYKMTAMFLRRQGDVWGFIAYSLNAEKQLVLEKVPRTQDNSQLFLQTSRDHLQFGQTQIAAEMQADLTPNFSLFFKNPASATLSLAESTLIDAHQIENPQLLPTDSLDCVHCHTAQMSRLYIKNQFSLLTQKSQYQNSKYNLKNITEKQQNTRNLRGMGYFENQLALSQRVIHDSAESAEALEKYLKIIKSK